MGLGNRFKKLFSSGKTEEKKADDEIVDESFEMDDESVTDMDDEIIEESTEISEEPLEDKKEVNDEPTQTINFKYLDDLIRSGVKEIVLDSDILLDDDEESVYKDGIKLDVDYLVIDGNGHTIDACGKARIFHSSGKNITIKNIILKNGFAKKNGGAIYNGGELTVSDSILSGNTARYDGGAIGNRGILTVFDSTLRENVAYDDGGAIHNMSMLTVSDSTLIENTAEKSGGAIYNSDCLNVSDSTLRENVAYGGGGAILNKKGEIHTKVFNCNFSNNKSPISIIENYHFLPIFNSDFRSNQAPTIIVNSGDWANFIIFNGEFKDNNINKSIIFNNEPSRCTVEKTIFEKHFFNIIINKSDLTLISPEIKFDGKSILNEKYIFIEKSSDGLEEKIYGGGLVENGDDVNNERIPDKLIEINDKELMEDKEEVNDGELVEDKEEVNDGELVEDKEEVNDEPAQTRNFKYLDDLIHNGDKEIVLDSDIVLDYEEESDYKGGIKLDVDDLVIEGNGHTIDACRKVQIFNCTGKNITIKNITLKNGSAGGGGAIMNYLGELQIINATFVENRSAGPGGAILNLDGELTLTETTLKNNRAFNGGAIVNEHGKLNIIESIITKNTSNTIGGAIRNFEGNIKITKSTFIENISKKGGAIYHNGGDVNVTDSLIKNNITKEGSGAAIYQDKGNFKFFNCVISNNESQNNIILSKDLLQVYDSIFKDNKSRFIIENECDESNLSVIGGEFIENNVDESVLFNNGKSCSIEKTIFKNNLSEANSNNIINKSKLTLINPKIKDKEKTILNDNYILIKKTSAGLENKIYGQGTVEIDVNLIPQGQSFDFGYLDKKIHENYSKNIILKEDICFKDYEIDYYEGGIELDIDDLVIDGNGHTIDGNGKSRIFMITAKNIVLKNITFKNGHSHRNLDNFLNNNGGAIKINHKTVLTIENCRFLNNTSEENGGAIYNSIDGRGNIIESTFINSAAKVGGAIGNMGELIISESIINENTTYADGGGGVYNNGKLSIKGSALDKNNAQKFGGAIKNEGELIIIDSTLTNNVQLVRNKKSFRDMDEENIGGGAIHNGGKLTIRKSALDKNTAYFGGAIRNGGELTITESILQENLGRWEGGAIYNKSIFNRWGLLTNESKYESMDCTFKDNEPDDVFGE